MAATDRRRAILQTIIDDPESSTSDVLRACELAEKLDARPELDPVVAHLVEFAQTLHAMTPEQLDAELEALGAPVKTGPSFEGDAVFEAAVEKRAKLLTVERTAELLQERHRLRTALAEAEARLAPAPSEPLREVSDLAERRKALSAAPSASQTASIEIPEALRRTAATATKPTPDRVRTTFERKTRGEI